MPRPNGPGAGVAVDDVDLSGVDAQPVGDDLGERGVEALAVRRGAAVDGHRARRVHAHDARTRRSPPAGRRRPGRRRARAPGRRSPSRWRTRSRGRCPCSRSSPARAERVEVEVLEQLVERAVVVAGVVDDPDRDLGGEVLLGDEVLPPQLERVHAQLVGQLLDHHLDQVGRLGPAGAAGGVGGHLVGEHALGGELEVRDLVTAADHEARERRDERRQHREEGAEVRSAVHSRPVIVPSLLAPIFT